MGLNFFLCLCVRHEKKSCYRMNTRLYRQALQMSRKW